MPAKANAKKRASTTRRKQAAKARVRSKNSNAKRSAAKDVKVGCPIVGIGGSAGGFEAAMEFLKELPARTEMAYVIVQHLDPHHTSRLASLLGRVTKMRVLEISRTLTPERNTVYVQPPNKCVICKNSELTLVRRT